MSPAGGWPQLLAAVANGADAVYLGLTSYSARARASNFDPDPSLLHHQYDNDNDDYYEPKEGQAASLAQAVKYAHRHHVRVYVAFNTLVFDEELHEVQELIEQIWDCGVDAVIVQDVGVSKIVKEVVDALSSSSINGHGRGLDGARMEIHASTQQTVTCTDGVEFAARRTNATRVVLGRELSLPEISAIASQTDIEIEAFVHGALCVSYSGQCFSSEAWGGRSANRGQCAQACRLPYGLIVSGELRHLSFDGIEGIMGGGGRMQNSGSGGGSGVDEVQYLLSPQDLCGLEQVEELVRAGVSCLKIEGRLKDSSYVAATTRAYRQAIDAAWDKVLAEQSIITSSTKRILSSPEEEVSRADLTHVFARGQDENHDGLTAGFFEGPKHQRLVRGRSPRHRGMHLGRVVSSSNNSGVLTIQFDDRLMDEAEFPLKRGDGIVVDRGMPQEEELGGPIYDVRWNARDGNADIRFGREVEHRWMDNDRRSRLKMAPRGAHVWKTSDSDVSKRMKRLAVLDPPKTPAKVVVSGGIDRPLTVQVIDVRSGKVGEASSDDLLQEAQKAGLNDKTIRKAIGTLGNSRWSLASGDIDSSSLGGNVWCPMSLIKETRRQALDNLVDAVEGSQKGEDEEIIMQPTPSYNDEVVVDQLLSKISTNAMQGDDLSSASVKLSVLARSYEQVDALCSMIESSHLGTHAVNEIVVDFLEIDGIRAAVSRIREVKGVRVVVASPRIIKPGEEGIWRTLLKTSPDGIMIRSTGLLHRLTQLGGAGKQLTIQSSAREEAIEVTIPELIGDFSLNAANAITAFELLQSGLDRITAAYDLSANAITELATLLGNKASQLEVVVHQHMPIFHTEHCVFARFLSKGDSYQDCGHVCTRNTVHLRDQNGNDNLVLADMGCRNTVFQAESQSGVYSLNEWVKAGVGHIRIELVDEKGEDAVNVVKAYLQFLEKEKQAIDVWSVLEGVRDSNGRTAGVGIGSLRNSLERRSGEITSSIH